MTQTMWMRNLVVTALFFACASPEQKPEPATTVAPQQPAPEIKKMKYPITKKGDVVDDLHGTKVPDPYRWLEDPDANETKAWVESQNKVTFGWLERVPARD